MDWGHVALCVLPPLVLSTLRRPRRAGEGAVRGGMATQGRDSHTPPSGTLRSSRERWPEAQTQRTEHPRQGIDSECYGSSERAGDLPRSHSSNVTSNPPHPPRPFQSPHSFSWISDVSERPIGLKWQCTLHYSIWCEGREWEVGEGDRGRAAHPGDQGEASNHCPRASFPPQRGGRAKKANRHWVESAVGSASSETRMDTIHPLSLPQILNLRTDLLQFSLKLSTWQEARSLIPGIGSHLKLEFCRRQHGCLSTKLCKGSSDQRCYFWHAFDNFFHLPWT